ncbi:hypothetical protein AB3329_10265 [Streptococcus sp. H31]|uniref:hypothetical protein n=1 Tax=Streptococcus huangxiaojuni TaxID=3237239 RepID=UPI0034A274E7
MAKKKGLSRPAKIFWGLLAAVLIAITGIWGYNRYMQKKKVDQLYQHGFRLLEEQIATYIKENYSGVSKIEFSPIYRDGDGRFTMLTAEVVPILYDEYGNKALLAGSTSEGGYPAYGVGGDLYALELDQFGNEIITLRYSANGDWIDVANYEHLPEEAKLNSHNTTDSILAIHIKDKKIKGVSKNENGSPKANIFYNLEIRKGDWQEWH